ncbi:Dolichyl-phosphate-mannose-protein mannosyltransferase [Cohnella sp. OV330]|uniref:glycosyltransferase family 39 protein n=1 Tax=Cohnella sp. OV330 TaxID=1855288 RepID=UPI0008EC23E9|nr:glycosyltransferase family 39 protein [Cohnella sp. OV330]SFB49396.1 Dolichyl-phosphate-mannose-protein mannosyltransferase [Cohnella sp. OV330]
MKAPAKAKVDLPLLFIVLLSAFLNGYDIWTEKYANTYYTTAVAAMMENFHNFFYASLDSAGSVTVDKPPVVFWIQTLSAKLFGLHGWSVILPQALAGIGSVLLAYKLVKPTFGAAAARVAALVMACTPIAVAVSRTNNIDSMLVFALLLAAALLFRGVRNRSAWSVMGAFAIVGVGFNMKMLQAYMVLPAFYLFYWIASGLSWKKRAGILAGATALMLAVSVSWAVVVDSVPADKRPYIGSSGTNSVLNLAFGYNGVSRLTGDRGQSGGGAPNFRNGGGFPADGQGERFGQAQGAGQDQAPAQGQGDGQSQSPGQNVTPGQDQAPGQQDGGVRGAPQGGGAGGFGGGFRQDGGGFGGNGGPNGGRSGGMFGTGQAGPLRLFQASLSDQASWFIPFAVIGAIGLLGSIRRRKWTDKHKETIFWLAWLLPAAAFFSVAGFFHQYYLIMLAPPIAALAGAGFVEMWRAYGDRAGWMSWLLPAAILATTVFAWYIVHPYDATIGGGWAAGIGLAGVIVTALLIVWRTRENLRPARIWAIAGLLTLLVGPVYWALTPITYGVSSMTPIVGPSSSREAGGPQGIGFSGRGQGGGESTGSVDERLYAYLKAHNTGQKYLLAVSDYGTAAPYMVDKGESVVILNGFNGSDQVYTAEKLQALAAKGEVKYFLIGGGGMGGGGRGGNAEVTQWIQEHGKAITASEWQSSSSGGAMQSDAGDGRAIGGFGGFGGGATLYVVDGVSA